MTLHELIIQEESIKEQLKNVKLKFDKTYSDLRSALQKAQIKVRMLKNNLNVEILIRAKELIQIEGNPYAQTDDVMKHGSNTIAQDAIIDIAQDAPKLKMGYFGNKKYEGFYQRSDHDYSFGPAHGSIVDGIYLRVRDRKLTDQEKDDCIYYLLNYEKIKSILDNFGVCQF